MRKALIGLFIVLLVAAPASAEVYNFLKQGYSFFDANTLGAVGLLEPLQTQNPPFDFDFDTYEVSWALLNMDITSYSEIGFLQVWEFAGGTVGIYEDDSFDLDYGVDPATGIATATNGTPALTGEVISSAMIFNTFTETGTFNGTFMFTGGTRLDELGILVDEEWYVFDGVSAADEVNVPPGYHSRFAGRFYADDITATEESSFSQIRALY